MKTLSMSFPESLQTRRDCRFGDGHHGPGSGVSPEIFQIVQGLTDHRRVNGSIAQMSLVTEQDLLTI